MTQPPDLVTQIDNVLPQTQCTLCGFAGCRPYAQAICDQRTTIDQCLPGGRDVLLALGQLTQQDVSDALPAMQEKQIPSRVAIIDPEVCIGCTKCIKACPVDAISGAAKRLHTIISTECTGCALCVPACPVDCIALPTIPTPTTLEKSARAQHAKRRYADHQTRQQHEAVRKRHKKSSAVQLSRTEMIKIRQQEIAAAITRATTRKQSIMQHTTEDNA